MMKSFDNEPYFIPKQENKVHRRWFFTRNPNLIIESPQPTIIQTIKLLFCCI
jgi:hypothetical protein